EITKYRSQLYAESTKATYKTHCDTYLRFCLYVGYTHLLQYTAFLALFLYESYVSLLHNHYASLGFDPKLFAGHPFRSGGASFAYQPGVPIELIEALSD
ncbi:hypothetical protein pdam_00023616, partial [Pocillopora damicornis]